MFGGSDRRRADPLLAARRVVDGRIQEEVMRTRLCQDATSPCPQLGQRSNARRGRDVDEIDRRVGVACQIRNAADRVVLSKRGSWNRVSMRAEVPAADGLLDALAYQAVGFGVDEDRDACLGCAGQQAMDLPQREADRVGVCAEDLEGTDAPLRESSELCQ